MVNSCNSRSPILLDTPERPGGASGSTVIEIPDSGERNHVRRRRLETVEDVIVTDSPKRARVDVPVIDLTTDNEEESSTSDINTERLFLSIQNSPRYAELRARCLPDETRYRIRRAISLRHRPTSHHPSNQVEERQSPTVSLNTRTESGRSNQLSSSARGENSGPPILVDDDDAPSGQSELFDRASGFSRPSCIRVSPPRIANTITDSARSSLSPSARGERNSRVSTQISLNGQGSLESDNERHQRGNRRDQLRIIRRHHRQLRENQRQLRERLGYISPFTNYSTSSNENFGRNVQRPEQQATEINHDEDLPSSFNEAVPQRLIRTPPAFPLDGQLRPYDIPDLLLPAVLSWWGPDSRLRHFGDPDDDREDYEALWSLTERLGQVKSRGLTKADMEAIPSFRYSAASRDSSNGSCVVCMMNYSNNEKLRRLPCNHDFHGKCIDRWLKNNRSCPVCRKDVTTK